jgi:hypothetical protein
VQEQVLLRCFTGVSLSVFFLADHGQPDRALVDLGASKLGLRNQLAQFLFDVGSVDRGDQSHLHSSLEDLRGLDPSPIAQTAHHSVVRDDIELTLNSFRRLNHPRFDHRVSFQSSGCGLTPFPIMIPQNQVSLNGETSTSMNPVFQ